MTGPGSEDSPPGGGGEDALAALVASRICHDVVSPVGAILYGLELLPAHVAATQEVALMRGAVETALARIELFRVAFGEAGGDAPVPAAKMRDMLGAAFADGRSAVEWADAAERPRAEMRLACLGVLCLESAAPRGARIVVAHGGGRWRLRAEAARLRVEPALWEPLARGEVPAGLRGAEVQFGLLARLAAANGRKPALDVAEGALDLTV